MQTTLALDTSLAGILSSRNGIEGLYGGRCKARGSAMVPTVRLEVFSGEMSAGDDVFILIPPVIAVQQGVWHLGHAGRQRALRS